MADLETPEGIVQIAQQAESTVPSAGETQINSSLGAQNEKLDGIHGVLHGEVTKAINGVNDSTINILNLLKDMLPGLTPLADELNKLNEKQSNLLDATESDADDGESNKQSKKKSTDSDVARLPAKYGAGSLLVYGQLETQFTAQNLILDGISKSVGLLKDNFFNSSVENATLLGDIKKAVSDLAGGVVKVSDTINEKDDDLKKDVVKVQPQKDNSVNESLIKWLNQRISFGGFSSSVVSVSQGVLLRGLGLRDQNAFKNLCDNVETITTEIQAFKEIIIENKSGLQNVIPKAGQSKKQSEKSDVGESKDNSMMSDVKDFVKNGDPVFKGISKTMKTVASLGVVAAGAVLALKTINVFLIGTKSLGAASKGGIGITPVDIAKLELIKLYSSVLLITFSSILRATQVASSMIISAGFGIKGVKNSKKFIKEVREFIYDKKSGVSTINIKSILSVKEKMKQLSIAFAFLFLAQQISVMLIIPSKLGLIGIKSSKVWVTEVQKFILETNIKLKKQSITAFLSRVKDISLAMISFSIAVIITAIMPLFIIPAIIGLFAMSLFISVLSFVGNLVGAPPLQKGIQNIQGISLKIALSFLLFTLALVVIGVILPKFLTLKTFEMLALVIVIFELFTLIGVLASSAQSGLKKFALSSILLLVSMVLFAVALVVISFIAEYLLILDWKIKFVMVVILALFAGFIVLGIVASAAGQGMVSVAAAAILMVASILLLAVALIVMSYIAKFVIDNIDNIKIGLIAVMGLFVFFVVLGIAAAAAVIPLFALQLATIFMAVSSILLIVSILALLALEKLIGMLKKAEDGNFSVLVDLQNLFKAFETIITEEAFDGILALAFAAVFLTVSVLLLTISMLLLWAVSVIISKFDPSGTLVTVGAVFLAAGVAGLAAFLALIPLAFLSIASILLLVSSAALLLSLLALNKISEIDFPSILKSLGLVAVVFVGMFVIGAAALVAMPFIAILAAASILLLISMVSLNLSMKALTDIVKGAPGPDETTKALGSITLLFAMMVPLGIAAGIAMVTITLVAAACVLISSIFTNIVKTYEAIDRLREIQGKIDPTPIISAVRQLVDIVKDAGKEMKSSSKQASESFATSLGAVTKCVSDIVDVIYKINDFGKESETIMKNAMIVLVGSEELNAEEKPAPGSIMGFISTTLVGALSGITGIDYTQLNTAQALVPLTQSISNIVDVIKSISNINTSLFDAATERIEKIACMFAMESGGLFGKNKGVGAFGILIASLETMKDTTKTSKKMDEVITMIGKISNLATSINNVPDVGSSISDKIVTPLSELTAPINNLIELSKSIDTVNKSLNNITKENRAVLNAFGKLGGSGIVTVNFNQAKEKSPTYKNPLQNIAENVEKIVTKMGETKASSSWATA